MIRNARHFYHALILVFKLVCRDIVFLIPYTGVYAHTS
ncbi:DUF3265 domain-containing protein [Vibrio alginolyticus]|nr:DUF3265 domain-containing protein [Vibrio alginolyticus]